MTIQDLGSIGEFIAAIATLITLIYLATQIRHNTATARASTLQSAVQFTVSLSESIYRDAEVSDLFDRGCADLASLSDSEKSRFHLIQIAFFRMCQNSHHQYLEGFIDEATFGGMTASIFSFVDRPGALEWWQANEERFDPGFRAFINGGLKPGGA